MLTVLPFLLNALRPELANSRKLYPNARNSWLVHLLFIVGSTAIDVVHLST
jgi:hypothetical protein